MSAKSQTRIEPTPRTMHVVQPSQAVKTCPCLDSLKGLPDDQVRRCVSYEKNGFSELGEGGYVCRSCGTRYVRRHDISATQIVPNEASVEEMARRIAVDFGESELEVFFRANSINPLGLKP